MVQVGARLGLAAILVAAAILKLTDARSSREALATFGLGGERARGRVAWWALIAAELVLAAGVAAGIDAAAYAASALLLVFAAALAVALRTGRAGAPCACFGSRSRVSSRAVARNLALAAAFAVVPVLPGGSLSTDEWLGLGLVVALLAVAGLVVAVLALAREIGVLRMQIRPQPALEIPHEGPEVGGRTGILDRIHRHGTERLALAVFTSEGCHLCRSVEPALEALSRDPLVAVEVFDEVAHADVWRALDVPGSPFAVAVDERGTVLAKGTFNSYGQLESILATAERRHAAGVGG
jgi:uncharacterized membrane protein YphA (DoxX/SURF4 family)